MKNWKKGVNTVHGMTCRRIIGILIKYVPLMAILILHILSLLRGTTTIMDEMDRSISIWKDVLQISAIIGEIGCLLVLDKINISLTGKTTSFVDDIKQESSQEVAIRYNGIVADAFLLFVVMTLTILYAYTQKRIFSSIATGITTLWVISSVGYIFIMYLKIKHIMVKSIFEKLSNPVFLPMIIFMVQILITREKWVEYVYYNICEPEDDVILTFLLIIILCYFLIIFYAHFSNVYCLIGFGFVNRNIEPIQKKIELLQEKEDKRDREFRQAIKRIDKRAEQVGFIRKIGLFFKLNYIHIRRYIQERLSAALYLISILNYKIVKRFRGLLNPERIKSNSIRCCLVTAVLGLLSLDMILFIWLESDSPCLKFFELLSTVIIIPILLSWLAELKSKAN